MAAEQVQMNVDDQAAGRHALKRRGILAAAGAVVAGIVAKQTAMPVAAASTAVIFATDIFGSPENHPVSTVFIDDGSFTNMAPGSSLLTLETGSASPTRPGLDGLNVSISNGSEASVGVASSVHLGTGLYGESSGNALSKAVHGKHLLSGYAVYGEALASMGYGVTGVSTNAFGVLGQSTNSMGVQGEITGGSTAGTVAVNAINRSTGTGGIGVQAESDGASGIGVIGTSTAGIGVKGVSASGFPIIGGVTGTGSASNGNAGVLGIGTAGPGVQGQSNGHGLVGTTFATDGQHAALIGSVQSGGNAIGLRGSIPPGATGFAGVFDGDVIVNGALRVFGSPKNAAVKHPGDGTYRLLYCEESPESWFADYGAAKLANGRAEVTLDAGFALLVHTDQYHVFLTPEGDSKGLYVTEKTPAGFAVQEQQGGTSGIGFSYRVVAKRKDIVGERLAKVAPPPPLKPVIAFTVPETPDIKPPSKKP